jgi:hypothetical protein
MNSNSVHVRLDFLLRAAIAIMTISVTPVFALGGSLAICKAECLESLKDQDEVQVIYLADSFARSTCSSLEWVYRVRAISKTEPLGTADCPHGLQPVLKLNDPPAVVVSGNKDSLVFRPEGYLESQRLAIPANAIDSIRYQRPAIKRNTLITTLLVFELIGLVSVFYIILAQPATNHM